MLYKLEIVGGKFTFVISYDLQILILEFQSIFACFHTLVFVLVYHRVIYEQLLPKFLFVSNYLENVWGIWSLTQIITCLKFYKNKSPFIHKYLLTNSAQVSHYKVMSKRLYLKYWNQVYLYICLPLSVCRSFCLASIYHLSIYLKVLFSGK